MRSAVLTTLAQVQVVFGDHARARSLIEESLAALEPAGMPVSAASFAYYTAALVAHHEKRYDDALAYLAKRLEVDPGDVPVPGVRPDLGQANLASAFHLRADVHRTQRRFQQAERDLQRCVALREELLRENPQRITYRLDRARSWVAMGYVMMALGKREDIEAWYQKAYDELAQLREEAPRNLDVTREFARATRGLGQIENTRAIHDHAKGSPGRIAGLKAALEHYDRAILLLREVQASRPESAPVRTALELTERMAAFTRRIVEGPGASDDLHGKKDGQHGKK